MDDRIDVLLRKAQKFLRSAAVLLEMEDYDSCASRAYFAMFYTVQALLLSTGGNLPTRQGIRSTFTQAFVTTGRLPARAEEALSQAYELQEVGDYGHTFAVPREQAEWALAEAEAFVNSLTRLIPRETS